MVYHLDLSKLFRFTLTVQYWKAHTKSQLRDLSKTHVHEIMVFNSCERCWGKVKGHKAQSPPASFCKPDQFFYDSKIAAKLDISKKWKGETF